ncbi:hypothetical protein chiPu_0005165 [Chiloscyllium punctatum]|uniref:Uncharacterized protein n=2 Tax=Chiloscyllium punctatum TaxID=137246 RepID=A0A401S8M1_CHIPU|nr:hypothetical protein [Chiloscyllium punctatum]
MHINKIKRPRLRLQQRQRAGYIVYQDRIVQKFYFHGITTMTAENLKSLVKRQLPFSGFASFQGRRGKSHAIGTDQENLLSTDQQLTLENIRHFKAKLKKVAILPTVQEIQESADGFQCESTEEPEQVKKTSGSKKVHIALIPDRYEPLIESLGENLNEESKTAKKFKRKQKLKKCKKNILKVLRAGWNYFVLGVQEFAQNYTMPYATSFTVIAEMR